MTQSTEAFDWIKIKQEIGSAEIHSETSFEKLKRKTKENPFVPFGVLMTSGFLGFGLYAMRTGQRRTSQLMMRGRIAAQAFTIVALCGGIAMTAFKQGEK